MCRLILSLKTIHVHAFFALCDRLATTIPTTCPPSVAIFSSVFFYLASLLRPNYQHEICSYYYFYSRCHLVGLHISTKNCALLYHAADAAVPIPNDNVDDDGVESSLFSWVPNHDKNTTICNRCTIVIL